MPKWLDDAVFYEIYPQSFCDSNGDGIGDLPGITEKLDYIRQLGCNAIWLNPCFDSPFHDAGYDVRDYKKIAPRYGTNEDMRRLLKEAHSRGMRVLLDLVPGHTSIEHEWFVRSMRGEAGCAGRYIWADEPFERFAGIEGISGYLNGVCERGSCAANYYSTQPALNYGFARTDKPWQTPLGYPDARATFEAIKDVMRFWLQMGCDGFRVDMAGSLVKNDEGQRETICLWQKYRRFLDEEFPEAALVSEWGNPARALKAGFHMDFLLHFGPTHYLDLFRKTPFFSKRSGGDISAFVENYGRLSEEADGGLICIPSGNHDMPRIARFLDTDDLKLAFVFLLSMPGAPFIYYGDEIGMRYLENTPSVEGGFERTGSRSPMQWDDSLNAGFSSAAPERLYIPLDPSENRPAVRAQMTDKDSLWSEVQRLLAIRQAYPALQNRSGIAFLSAGPSPVPLVYRRGEGEDAVYVALNPSAQSVRWDMGISRRAVPVHTIGGTCVFGEGELTLDPCSAVIFTLGS